MDTATLVDEQIQDGKNLIVHLNQASFPVTVAAWVLTSNEGLWFFFIASKVVDDEGPAPAYRKVYAELSRSGIHWISRSDIKLICEVDPIALDAIKYRSGILATRFGGRKLGDLIVEEAYIYPE